VAFGGGHNDARIEPNKRSIDLFRFQQHEFPCTLDRFFKEYIADGAEFSMEKFMQSKQGDKDLKTSAWKPSEQDGKLVRKRVIRFIHPVNAPMAPPEAQARKEQTYQRFGDNGFIVETKTIVVGVPMTDCFFVKDRLVVAAAPGNKVLVSMEFELEFVKSTMFRGVITKTTNSQVSKYCEQWRDYMAESLGEEAAPPKQEEQKTEKETIVEEMALPYGLTKTSLTHILLASVIFMQFWMVLEMRSMKNAIYRMEMSKRGY
jgi:VAD1 Analog of StAR-related lipid transfer domain